VPFPQGISKSAVKEHVDLFGAVLKEMKSRAQTPDEETYQIAIAITITSHIIQVANAKEVLNEVRHMNLRLCDVLGQSLRTPR
jgi:hypothetical protein